MKRFLVFTGYFEKHYNVGWQDFAESFDTLQEAREFLEANTGEWWQIVDYVTGTIVLEWYEY